MLNVFKTMLLSAAFLSGIFASNGIQDKPESIDSSINHSTFVNASSTPRMENSSPKRTVSVKQVATSSQSKNNAEDDDCVVIGSLTATPLTTPNKKTAASDSLGVTPNYSDIQSANSKASNTPPSTPRKQNVAIEGLGILYDALLATPGCSNIPSANNTASNTPLSTPREQNVAIGDLGVTSNYSNIPSDSNTTSNTPPSTPRAQTLPAEDPEFTNNSALATYIQMAKAGVFSRK